MAKLLLNPPRHRRLVRREPAATRLRAVWNDSSDDLNEAIRIRNLTPVSADSLEPQNRFSSSGQARQRSEAASDLSLPDTLRGRETLLVVDETPLMREAVAGILRQLGYRVFEAADSREAQHHAHAQRNVHLVVIDLPVPEINRFELAQWFRAIYPETRVLLITDWLWGLNLDLDRPRQLVVLAKPFSPLELARMVRLILDDARAANLTRERNS